MADSRDDFAKFFLLGGNGFVDGISDDAPPEARRECEKLLRKEKTLG